MNKLVYNGELAASFLNYHRVLEPGDAFTVSDDELAGFLARPDIDWADETTPEPVEPDPEPAKPAKKTAQ